MPKKKKKVSKIGKMFKKMKGTSNLETKFAEILAENDINFEQHVEFKKREYDFLLTDHNIFIETHGCFFHCCKKHNPEVKYAFQRNSIKNDLYKVKLIKFDLNYTLLTIWEHEMEDIPILVEKLSKFITKHSILLKD